MTSEPRLCHLSGGRTAPRSPDAVVAEFAARQHGVVTRAQLLHSGVGRRAIDRRIARGLLHPLHRGVFAVGHRRVGEDGRWMAAVLAGGEGAVLSHRSAAALWRMRNTSRRPEVTVARHRGSRPGVEYHEAVLQPDEIAVERGIPVTTPARTLLDLARAAPSSRTGRRIAGSSSPAGASSASRGARSRTTRRRSRGSSRPC